VNAIPSSAEKAFWMIAAAMGGMRGGFMTGPFIRFFVLRFHPILQ
jgi:hypothetical protein